MRTSRHQLRRLVLLLASMMLTASGCDRGASIPNESFNKLQQLEVIDRPGADPSYRRAAFGRAWADVDGDGCNTRDQVLYSTRAKDRAYLVRRQGRCPTDMVAGTWTDLYTQREMTWTNLKDPEQAQELPLDHILSLAAAWRYGARDWTSDERLRFANDPLGLTATTAAVNRSKSDHNPGDWTPPRAGRCDYATRYVTIKSRYRLPVDAREKTALQGFLGTCPR